MSTLHDRDWRGFASDNYAGLHPEVLAALADANGGHEVAYGEDSYTARLQEVVASHVGAGAVTWPVFNGTGANVVALQALLPRWGAVVCADTAHVHTDEGGAPERMGSIKLLPVSTPDGKLTPELIDRQAWGFGDEHRAQPLVVSITQTTELGTCYTPEEVRAISDHAHSLGMRVHLDGARISNAAASLGTDLSAFTSAAGVDVLSLGGTKNGALAAEAVVVVEPELAQDPSLGMVHVRKFSMQLSSKMRFVSAQLLALYGSDLWLRSAHHANAMATRLASGVRTLDGVHVTQAVQANAVFALLDGRVADALRESFRFYDWNPATGEVRWMCSWDTTEADVDAFVAELTRLLNA